MNKIKIVCLFVVVFALLCSCLMLPSPKPFNAIPTNATTAFICLSEGMSVTHVDGRRVSMSSVTKRHAIEPGDRELTLTYTETEWDAGRQREVRRTARGIKVGATFESGKSYVIVNDVEGYAGRFYSNRTVTVFLVENTEQSITQVALPKYKSSLLAVAHIMFNPDGSRFIVIHERMLYVHNTSTGTLEYQIRNSRDIFGGIWSHDGTKILIADERNIRILDASSGNDIRSLKIARSKRVVQMHMTPDNTKLVGSSGDTLKVWDMDTETELVSINGLYQLFGITFITLSPDGQFFAASFSDNTTRIYSINGGTPVLSIGERRETYIPIEFVDSDTLIAVQRAGGSFNAPKTVSICINTREVTELESYTPSISFSHDGSINFKLVSASGRTFIREIDVETDEVIRQYTSPNADIRAIILSPTENKFATFSYIDGIIRIWEF